MNWIPFMQPKQKKQFNLEATYITVEFLTEDEKVEKDKIIDMLNKQYQDDLETIIPYSSAFRYSFRYTLNTAVCNPNINGKIKLEELLVLLEGSSDQKLSEFLETYPQRYKIFLHNNQLVQANQILPLYNERDISSYDPSIVLEIIYQKKSLFDRLKKQSVKFVKDIPKKIMNLGVWIVMSILRMFGINYGKGLIMKLMPLKGLMTWLLGLLTLFFPALGPILGIGKMLMA